jgi:zinc transporter ZupT
MSRRKSFSITFFLEASTTVAGGLIGLFVLVPESTRWIGYVLGHVGGGFVFLVIHALLSEVIKHHPRSTVFAALLGAASIGIVSIL